MGSTKTVFHRRATNGRALTALAVIHRPQTTGVPAGHVGATGSAVKNGSCMEVRLPSELGFEKVAMCTAAGMAGLMGFSHDPVAGPEDSRRRGLYQCHGARQST